MATVTSRARLARGRVLVALAAVTMAAGLAAIPAAATAAAARPTAGARAANTTPGHAQSQSTALAMLEQRARSGMHRQIPHASEITGTVVGADGLSASGACVTAFGRSGSVTASAAPSGEFTIAGLAAGSYTLEYRDCVAAGPHRAIWSGGVGWQRSAARVLVGTGQVRHVPVMTLPATPATVKSRAATWRRFLADASGRGLSAAAAAKTGQISGVVTGKGRKLRGVCIVVFPVNGGQGYGAATGKNGSYVVRHVPVGRYDVTFATIFCNNQNWLQQVYKGHNTPFGFGGNPVRVTSGKTTRGIDAKLRLGGQISGIVTARSGRKLGGICVDAEGTVPGGFVGIGLQTAGDGSYAVHALFPGKYTVDFSIGCGNNKNYGPAALKPIKITYGKRVTGQKTVLVPGGVFTGTVRLGSKSGTPLAGICVQATSGAEGNFFSFGFGPGTGATNSAGRYRLIGLGTGTYQVDFSPGCNSNANYVPTTKFAHATQGKITGGVNAVLVPGAEISGTVTDTHANQLGGICMQLNGPSGGNSPGATFSDGSYFVNQLPAGTYQLGFSTGCGSSGNYAPYWYNNQTDQSLATPIKLTRGASLTINPQMQPGAEISGAVTDVRGRKLTGICVFAATPLDAQLFGSFGQMTNSYRGAYHITGLAPGQYMVQFGGCGSQLYADQWFPNAPSAAAADILSVPAGQTTGVNAVLRPGGSISGTVRGPSGKPLAGVCVEVFSTQDRNSAIIVIGGPGPTTNSRGAYRISSLAQGRYDVLFSQCTVANPRYSGQWYRGQNSQLSATPVRVRAGATTSGIGATMRLGGAIAGRVVDSAGKPLNNVCVFADNPGGQFGFATTGKAGTYTMRGLATGSYTVTFSPCNSPMNLVSVTRHIKVIAPRSTSGVNARLVPGGSASGVVTAASSGGPAAFTCVEFISADPANPGGFGFTGTDGSYLATGIAPGSYQVLFNDPLCGIGPAGLAPQWYNNQPTQATATNVTITVGHTTPGIDAALQTDGIITGTVHGPSSAALGGICVTAMPLAAGSVPVVAVSGKSGGFTLIDMVPGRYKVEFSSGCGANGYKTQWWKNAASRQAATVINVAATQTVTGIDATLTR